MKLASILPLTVKRALRRISLDAEARTFGERAKEIRAERYRPDTTERVRRDARIRKILCSCEECWMGRRCFIMRRVEERLSEKTQAA